MSQPSSPQPSSPQQTSSRLASSSVATPTDPHASPPPTAQAEPIIPPTGVSRRGAMLAGSAAALTILAGAPHAARASQPFGKDKDKDKDKKDPKAPRQIDLKRLITPGDRHDWTFKVDIDVNAYVEKDSDGMPVINKFKFDNAVLVFPVLKTTASHRTYTQTLKSKLSFNDAVVATQPTGYSDAYPCGTRLGKWEMTEKTGREVRFELELPMTCWQTRYEEEAGDLVPWPASWPAIPMSTFTDEQRVGRNRAGNDIVLIEHNATFIQELVKKWTNGKDPKTIRPAVLAKYLAGEVMEYIQPSGDGIRTNKLGLEGFDLIGAEYALRQRRASEHDIACALAAVYRAAGLPARLVIGYDLSKDKGKDATFLSKKPSSVPLFRTWVEFALYHETAAKEVWIPVDINRQRKASSRNTGNWKFFGNNDEFDTVLPVSHQFHPPTMVMAHGSPAFWGWQVRPEALVATQFLRFNSQTTPKSVNTNRERAED